MTVSSPRLLALVTVLVTSVLECGWLDSAASAATWLDRYDVAVHRAIDESKLLMLVFYDAKDADSFGPLDRAVDADPALAEALGQCVCARLPLSATQTPDPASGRLTDHPAFGKLEGRPGMVVLDFAHADAPYYGRPVSVIAPLDAQSLTADVLKNVVALPAGNLAQRTRAYESRRSVPAAFQWLDDYGLAYHRARRDGKMLLVYFQKPGSPDGERFERETLGDADVQQGMAPFVCVRLTTDAVLPESDPPVRILAHRSFQEMLDREGVAVVDLEHKDASYYGQVVSTFPLLKQHWYTPARMKTILDLPPGTLTQRTMIYAVRVHPERPASTQGAINTNLLSEAEKHSAYQARIRLQGHHAWGTRFQRILTRLPGGLTPTEVCAESWPGERLLEAALDCVDC